jgi:hypothetical protein
MTHAKLKLKLVSLLFTTVAYLTAAMTIGSSDYIWLPFLATQLLYHTVNMYSIIILTCELLNFAFDKIIRVSRC